MSNVDSLHEVVVLRARVAELERERDRERNTAAMHQSIHEETLKANLNLARERDEAVSRSHESLTESEGPDYSGLCSAPECGGHCGYTHAVGCEVIREYLAEHGGAPYKAPARTAHLAPSAPTPRDMRVAEAWEAFQPHLDAAEEALARGIQWDGDTMQVLYEARAVVAKAVGT